MSLVQTWQRFWSPRVLSLINRNLSVMQPIVSSIEKLLKKKLNIYPPVLTLKTDLKKDLHLVDWEMLYLLNAVEQTWEISIPLNDSENIICIEHLLAAVKKQKSLRA